MATRNKFRELSLGPSDAITRRNSVAGFQVIADYLDVVTGQRMLQLKRIETVAAAAPKLKQVRKKRQQTRTQAAAAAIPTDAKSQTGFTEADRGA